MAKKELIDYLGWNTGAALERYAWRSKPTRSPLTGRAVRCIVVGDDGGRYWGGARIGPGGGEKCRNDLWIKPFAHKEDAIKEAREMTRDFLTAEAERQADRVPQGEPGKELVRVTMDDGWSVAINAPGTEAPDKARPHNIFERIGKSHTPPLALQKKRREREGPER